jgi:hypothetical protein
LRELVPIEQCGRDWQPSLGCSWGTSAKASEGLLVS